MYPALQGYLLAYPAASSGDCQVGVGRSGSDKLLGVVKMKAALSLSRPERALTLQGWLG